MYYYLLNGVRYDDEEELAEVVLEDLDSDYYDDCLNNSYSFYEIEGIRFHPSTILKTMDETAYWQGYDEYVDSLKNDLIYDLRHMGVNSSEDFYGCTVECCEEDGKENEDEAPKQPAEPAERGIFGDLLFKEI